MYFMLIFLFFVQACLIQNVFSQCAPEYGIIGTSQPAVAVLGTANSLATAEAIAEAAAIAANCYGGHGIGTVGVVGQLPVCGNTLVTAQVPVIGGVKFVGAVSAKGGVTITGACVSGCGKV